MAFDSTVTVNEGNYPMQERQRGGIREILDQFLNETNPVYKYATLAEAMQQLNPDNLEETLEVFESIPFGFESMQEYRMLFYAWSQFDPYGAIDYCKSRASGMGAGFAVSGFWKVGHHEIPGSTSHGLRNLKIREWPSYTIWTY